MKPFFYKKKKINVCEKYRGVVFLFHSILHSGFSVHKGNYVLFENIVICCFYESRKRELKIRLMNKGRCDERLKVRV